MLHFQDVGVQNNTLTFRGYGSSLLTLLDETINSIIGPITNVFTILEISTRVNLF